MGADNISNNANKQENNKIVADEEIIAGNANACATGQEDEKILISNNEQLRTDDQIFAMKINEEIIPITTIIPEIKLLNATDDDVMFQSNVKRLLNQKIGNHISQSFCDRFCVATRNIVRLYKSKEQFLKISKPTNVFPLNGIKSVKRFYLKGNKKLHFFVIELMDWNNKTGIYS